MIHLNYKYIFYTFIEIYAEKKNSIMITDWDLCDPCYTYSFLTNTSDWNRKLVRIIEMSNFLLAIANRIRTNVLKCEYSKSSNRIVENCPFLCAGNDNTFSFLANVPLRVSFRVEKIQFDVPISWLNLLNLRQQIFITLAHIQTRFKKWFWEHTSWSDFINWNR